MGAEAWPHRLRAASRWRVDRMPWHAEARWARPSAARLAWLRMASRVLITEPLAQVAMETLTAAGLDVDVAVGLSPDELLGAVRGASALIIRSATQVTAEVLEAGTELVVVGR